MPVIFHRPIGFNIELLFRNNEVMPQDIFQSIKQDLENVVAKLQHLLEISNF